MGHLFGEQVKRKTDTGIGKERVRLSTKTKQLLYSNADWIECWHLNFCLRMKTNHNEKESYDVGLVFVTKVSCLHAHGGWSE